MNPAQKYFKMYKFDLSSIFSILDAFKIMLFDIILFMLKENKKSLKERDRIYPQMINKSFSELNLFPKKNCTFLVNCQRKQNIKCIKDFS
jgi:hypothetical protein